jgi:hypothetical protein
MYEQTFQVYGVYWTSAHLCTFFDEIHIGINNNILYKRRKSLK